MLFVAVVETLSDLVWRYFPHYPGKMSASSVRFLACLARSALSGGRHRFSMIRRRWGVMAKDGQVFFFRQIQCFFVLQKYLFKVILDDINRNFEQRCPNFEFIDYNHSYVLHRWELEALKRIQRTKSIGEKQPTNQFSLSWTQTRRRCGIGGPAPDYLTSQRGGWRDIKWLT